ncbi:hypothetical protein CEUSTIGMA_g6453.t1 [Chlamydomonas eustigma]|uniref:2-(3-amino-3-carboxypropyl)histidine synthase subunit 1 n=1 Tax=Chlamydomonas eustigma TaxID=1157962 RepID=A0A250X7F3_9CHLO|nr:hypothetical protein CEUSTIGMA_g6453.t1 [Chlamydomonas eustigma]|eukprot:GAX79013.1 hypothetical protein CEUSTIGMA_g6453.t1 [Chlamydomonas eustigma]
MNDMQTNGDYSARRFSGQATSSSSSSSLVAVAAPASIRRFTKQLVTDSILNNAALNAAIKVLPENYNFEIHKTVWRIKQAGAKLVAIQFPEGLLMYACMISDILEEFADVEQTFILGDVTYGACCVDDFSALALGAQFLVHYGHSCLVPVDVTTLPCMYVFVDISIDIEHLVGTVELNFRPGTRIALAGTIQFSSAIQLARHRLSSQFPSLSVPKCKPLSPGEVLGCTAPVIEGAGGREGGVEAIVFVADGRFHLEAIMIANPSIPAFRYDPYARVLTQEYYDQQGMRDVRKRAIETSRSAKHWGLILGTLGRQGNPHLMDMLKTKLLDKGLETTVFLMSEISPVRLAKIQGIQAFVQVACPRLSIDWGEGFALPTLTPYEALVALGDVPGWWEDDYRKENSSRSNNKAASSEDAGGGLAATTQVSEVVCLIERTSDQLSARSLSRREEHGTALGIRSRKHGTATF